MVNLTVRLGNEELKGIEELIRRGRYRNRSEVVRAAIELLLYRLSDAATI